MTMTAKLTDFLERNKVPYEIVVHPKRYSAVATADIEQELRSHFAKVVMVKLESQDVMFVIPADHKLDLLKISCALGTDFLRVEKEKEFKDLFSDCEPGAMPPFGSLYKIPCYVDVALAGQKEILFNAGGHEESIKITASDYLRFAEAEIGDFSVQE